MLKRIKIENFKGIKNGEVLNLKKVNVFIGKNNSGKSCVLEALCLVRCAFNEMLLSEYFLRLLLCRRGVERSTYVLRNFWYGYKTEKPILLNLEFIEGEKLNVKVDYLSNERLKIFLEDPLGKVRRHSNSYFCEKILYLFGQGELVGGENFLPDFAREYPNIHHYLSNLTLMDDYIARKLEELERNVFNRMLEPRLDKKVANKLSEIYEVDAEGLTYIPIPQTTNVVRLAAATPKQSLYIDDLGDGAKYMTSIFSMALLLENTALLIEEIESHQHPDAIRKFLLSLLSIAQERNIQLFITTHSLEVIQTLSELKEKFEIGFFHTTRSVEGELTTRFLTSIDTKLLLDLGVDIRTLEAYKKFIIVEGKEDEIFIHQLQQKYGQELEKGATILKAWSKDQVKGAIVTLASTGKEIIAVLDYNKDEKSNILNSIENSLRNRYEVTQEGNVFKVKETNSSIKVLLLGLPYDETLRNIDITFHEMEDHCLKLLEVDENLKKWAGLSLKELAENVKKAKIEGRNKSSTLLKQLAALKGRTYEDIICYIIQNASKDSLEKVITEDMKDILP
jgi:AAA15 family ATPase/GTPase